MKTAEALKQDPFARDLSSCPHALKFGAVFPDVLFYLAGPSDTARYRRIAQACHGVHGEDTYVLLRRIAASLAHSPYPAPLRAFLAGVACHIQTDVTFHPFVYYLTGNYDDDNPFKRSRSVTDHRRLECLLDLYFCNGANGIGDYTLRHILSCLEMPLDYVHEVLVPLCADMAEYPSLIPRSRQALRNFRILQGLFQYRGLPRFLFAVAPRLSPVVREMEALFYSPALDSFLPRLNGPLSYRNPVTGTTETTTLAGLFDQSVSRSVQVVESIGRSVSTGAPVLTDRGPSLAYGLAANAAIQPRYFAEKPFFPK